MADIDPVMVMAAPRRGKPPCPPGIRMLPATTKTTMATAQAMLPITQPRAFSAANLRASTSESATAHSARAENAVLWMFEGTLWICGTPDGAPAGKPS